MTTLAMPEAAPAPVDDDDLEHTYCCDPLKSLCGIDFDEDDPDCLDDCGHERCIVCEAAMDGPCSSPTCPERSWVSRVVDRFRT